MTELVQEAAQQCLWQIGKRQVDLEIASTMPFVTGDPGLLRVVLTNLISNAIKYTGNRTVAHVEIGCENMTDDEATFFVRDNGIAVNRLHQQGFPTVGCAPCTRAVEPGGDVRSGRWWWENPEDKECGLHLGREQHGSGI